MSIIKTTSLKDFAFVFIYLAVIEGLNAQTCVQLDATQDRQYIYSHDNYGLSTPYPSNSNLCWLIGVDSSIFTTQVRIRLVIESINLEYSLNCTLDYLEIYSGNNSDPGSNMHGRYCTPTAVDVISEGYSMHLKFVSDNDKQEKGFKLSYKAVLKEVLSGVNDFRITPVLVNGCQYLEAPSYDAQIFNSHDGFSDNENYPIFYDACWIIHISTTVGPPIYDGFNNSILLGGYNQIYYNLFDIEYDSSCSLDYIDVYDGNTTDSFLSKQCGSSFSSVFSSGEYMYVHFHSDKSETFRGFQLRYYTGLVNEDSQYLPVGSNCQQLEATSEKKYFTSHPDFGQEDYGNNYYACWIIIVGTGKPNDVVQLRNNEFNVQKKSGKFSRCTDADYMTLYKGPTDGQWIKHGSYCGTYFYELASSGKYMYVTFQSDSSSHRTGFRIEYSAVDLQFPVWGIILLILGGILLLIAGVIGLIIYCNYESLKAWWPTRSCDCLSRLKNKFKRESKYPEVRTNSTNADDIDIGAAASMDAVSSLTTETQERKKKTKTYEDPVGDVTDLTQTDDNNRHRRRKKQLTKIDNDIDDDDHATKKHISAGEVGVSKSDTVNEPEDDVNRPRQEKRIPLRPVVYVDEEDSDDEWPTVLVSCPPRETINPPPPYAEAGADPPPPYQSDNSSGRPCTPSYPGDRGRGRPNPTRYLSNSDV